MTKHTPGPWAANLRFSDIPYIVPAAHIDRPIGGSVHDEFDRDRYAQIIATLRVDRHKRGDMAANARLLAAAPDLLNAAREMLAALGAARVGDYAAANWMNEAERAIKAAIAKTEAP